MEGRRDKETDSRLSLSISPSLCLSVPPSLRIPRILSYRCTSDNGYNDPEFSFDKGFRPKTSEPGDKSTDSGEWRTGASTRIVGYT